MRKVRQRHAPLTPEAAALSRVTRRRMRQLILAIAIPALVLGGAGLTLLWYGWALRPLDKADTNHVRVTVASGSLSPDIARQLKDARLIRSDTAFEIYARLSGQENKLQAGTYAFAPNQSVSDIVARLVSGKTDQFAITITPGQTLADIRTMLEGHGYTAAEIGAAMGATYPVPVVAERPAGTSLEGMFYPDTYNVLSDESLQTIFARIFAHYNDVVTENGLQAGFAAHGLSLYQGITLASIVQREVPGAEDQKKVASVFYNRLDADIALGSDVTYIYGASLLGVEPTPSLSSPYNTRIVKGLPPTPISNPGLSALQAVANPAQTDYLFFLSGDDNVTYFAHTDAEHEANIAAHCKVKCQ